FAPYGKDHRLEQKQERLEDTKSRDANEATPLCAVTLARRVPAPARDALAQGLGAKVPSPGPGQDQQNCRKAGGLCLILGLLTSVDHFRGKLQLGHANPKELKIPDAIKAVTGLQEYLYFSPRCDDISFLISIHQQLQLPKVMMDFFLLCFTSARSVLQKATLDPPCCISKLHNQICKLHKKLRQCPGWKHLSCCLGRLAVPSVPLGCCRATAVTAIPTPTFGHHMRAASAAQRHQGGDETSCTF
ncbi:hypothetical protein IHE44_0011835, partial [Lamprotornis superbus]